MSGHWTENKLGTIIDVAVGQGAPQGGDNFGENGRPFVRAGSLGFLTRGGKEADLEKIDEDVANAHGLRLFPRKTIVFAKSGMSATKGLVYRLKEPCYVVSHLAALLPSDDLDPSYLTYWLAAHPPSRLISNAAYPSIRLSQIQNVTIGFPSDPSEQRRIAAILDKADAIQRKRREAINLLDDFLRSVFIDMFGDPTTNPKGLPIGRIRELFESVNYGTSKKADVSNGTFPVIRMNNITYEGGWDFGNLKYIDLDEGEQSKHLVHSGQLLFNRTNSKELVGKTAVYRGDEPMAFAGYLVRGIAKKGVDAEYIAGYLNSVHGKLTLFSMCKSIVGMANINAKEMQSIPILIPPRDAQNTFGNIVRSVEKKKEKYIDALKKSEDLFNSLVQRAFTVSISVGLHEKKAAPKKTTPQENQSAVGDKLVIPASSRYALDLDVYAYRFVQQILRESGGTAPVRTVARAYAILSDLELVKTLSKDVDQALDVKEWLAGQRQAVDLNQFMPTIGSLIKREFMQWTGDGLKGNLQLTEDADPEEKDAWIVGDAKLALMLTKEVPIGLETSPAFVEIERLIAVA